MTRKLRQLTHDNDLYLTMRRLYSKRLGRVTDDLWRQHLQTLPINKRNTIVNEPVHSTQPAQSHQLAGIGVRIEDGFAEVQPGYWIPTRDFLNLHFGLEIPLNEILRAYHRLYAGTSSMKPSERLPSFEVIES